MAITTTEILNGINAAEFDAASWAKAMLYMKLTVDLGIVRGRIANVQAWQSGKVDEATAEINTLRAEEAALEEQINALAPTP